MTFKSFLRTLLLVHGSWNYYRFSRLICYFFYKNICVTFCQVWYAMYSGFSGMRLFNAWYYCCCSP